MSKELRISIGCDPELFLRNKDTGQFISAHTLLPGTKLKPFPVNLGAVQVDGVAAEFNIAPSYTPEDFVRNIHAVQFEIKKFVGDTIELVDQPVAIFDSAYFKTLPEEVRELGCNPDWNAWTGQVNPKPNVDEQARGGFMRTAAGHIHVGWGDNMDPLNPTHFEDCKVVAKQLDYFLGMYSLMWDKDTDRRKMYGRAGSFRPKPYGMEYRPLSNVWLRSQQLQSWIWKAAYQGINSLISGKVNMEDKFGALAEEVINKSTFDWYDTKEGKSVLMYTGLTLPPVPKERTETVNVPDKGRVKKPSTIAILDEIAAGWPIENTASSATA